ncbi:cullin-binding protein, putative [Bodo saltans]|uniref:Defective in cullin neddylation protein n=1 Tax=Bodo saltans TaxID=75058 RepID=A0A0S4KLZ2_BODSA|nr:cullin-binding protein, putative [Bodo saltans]|eukprot:CUI15632.1 cullin-binding protein, putative [Bodo saltans]
MWRLEACVVGHVCFLLFHCLARKSSIDMSAKPVPKAKAPPAKPPQANASTSETKSKKAATTTQAASAAEKAAVRGRSEMEQIFDKYRTLDRLDEAMDAIGPKGLTQLCSDIGTNFGDLDSFILVWKLGATQSGCITRSEWMHGMYQWKIEHIGTIKTLLPQWRVQVEDDETMFTEMYYHLYDFVRGDEDKLLPVEKALKAWQVLLPESERFPLFTMWVQWISTEYKRNVTRDLWRQLWEFARKIGKNIQMYDSNDKWPTALDDFVDWAREKIAAKDAAQRERDAARTKTTRE